MSPQEAKAVYARHYAAAGEVYNTFRWCSRVTKRGTGRLIHGLLKQTHFCMSFIALWSQNGSFETPQSCQFFNRSLIRSSPLVKWLIKPCPKHRRLTWDICEVRNKVYCCKTGKDLNVDLILLRIQRSQLRWFGHVFRSAQEGLARGNSCWLNPRAPAVNVQGPSVVITYPNVFGPV